MARMSRSRAPIRDQQRIRQHRNFEPTPLFYAFLAWAVMHGLLSPWLPLDVGPFGALVFETNALIAAGAIGKVYHKVTRG